jgi:hypothetical protein
VFADSLKLIFFPFAFEFGLRLKKCDWMRLFKGLIGVDSVADFGQLYFSYWTSFNVIEVRLVNMTQCYNLRILLLIHNWSSQYHVILKRIMHWFDEHTCKFLVLNWHLILGLIQPIKIAKPWPILKLGLGDRPSQNRIILCIKISLGLDDRWQTVSLCPYRSIVAQRFQPFEIVSSKPFSAYCLF